ncbi:MAG: peptidoglycan editing factor PgeF [Desulfobulbaceae bacterium]|nr:peptidoglycan editing factor PgeF [Desulfobulbaceae bacterium]
MFDRHGGVSRGLYASLNVGDHVGDQEEAVQKNRERVRDMLALPYILSAKQVHGTDIFCLAEPLAEDREVDGFDALITDLSGVGLMIQQADCQAVLLFDPLREVIAAVHCGWRGSVQGILQRVISVMVENYGTTPADLQAIISPSLGPCCAEFVNFRHELPVEFQQFMVEDNYFDFWQITRHQLMSAGMAEEKIGAAAVCTCCSDDYFSYRRASRLSGGLTGRNCSVISLLTPLKGVLKRAPLKG